MIGLMLSLAMVGGGGDLQVARELPIRGLHLMGPSAEDLPALTSFIRKDLPKEGVNTLVLEFDFNFQFKKRPEMAPQGALSLDQIKQIVAACREAKVRLIPQINLLGHQSWAENNGQLLKAHPEFDETPGKFPKNEGIYCRSYCPRHPEVHKVLFDCIDELADACEADAFHVGMDEVFILADADCARCKGTPTDILFGEEVQRLHSHLKSKGREMWMWGDRYLDGKETGLGEWEAATNGTAPALRTLPKDVVVCDWHYEKAEPTAVLFALNGNRVVSSPWRKIDVALGQLDLIRKVRSGANAVLANRMAGVLATTWSGCGAFIKAYNGDESAGKQASEAAACFKELMRAARSGGPAK